MMLIPTLQRPAFSFNPTQEGNCILWLDASRITGLADAAAVTTWSDLSGNANDASQSTAAKKPIYKVNIINGKPVVRFDGTDDLMTCANEATFDFGANTDFSYFVVMRSATSHTDTEVMIDKRGETGGADSFEGWGLSLNTSGTIEASGLLKGDTATKQFDNDNVNVTDTNPHVISVTCDRDGNGVITVDGGNATTTDISGSGSIDNEHALALGASQSHNPDSFFFTGDIAEFIVYNALKTGAAQTRIERYLRNKYNI